MKKLLYILSLLLLATTVFAGDYDTRPSSTTVSKVLLDNGSTITLIEDGALKTITQDQYTEIIDLHITSFVDNFTLLSNYPVDTTSINIETEGVTPTTSHSVCLKEGTAFYQGQILSVTPISGNQYTVTLDTPFDYPFTTAGGCSIRNESLAVNGSVTPVIFKISPARLTSGIKWDVTRVIFTMLDDVAMDDAKFGGIASGLPKGIVLRVVNNGGRKNIFNAKTNGDLRDHMYDIQYIDNAPAGFYGLGGRRSFSGADKNGVVIRLVNDDEPDELQLIVQDDLTALADFKMIVQGHVVQGN